MELAQEEKQTKIKMLDGMEAESINARLQVEDQKSLLSTREAEAEEMKKRIEILSSSSKQENATAVVENVVVHEAAVTRGDEKRPLEMESISTNTNETAADGMPKTGRWRRWVKLSTNVDDGLGEEQEKNGSGGQEQETSEDGQQGIVENSHDGEEVKVDGKDEEKPETPALRIREKHGHTTKTKSRRRRAASRGKASKTGKVQVSAVPQDGKVPEDPHDGLKIQEEDGKQEESSTYMEEGKLLSNSTDGFTSNSIKQETDVNEKTEDRKVNDNEDDQPRMTEEESTTSNTAQADESNGIEAAKEQNEEDDDHGSEATAEF